MAYKNAIYLKYSHTNPTLTMACIMHNDRDHFVYEPSQWMTTLYHNAVSHSLRAYTKWSL